MRGLQNFHRTSTKPANSLDIRVPVVFSKSTESEHDQILEQNTTRFRNMPPLPIKCAFLLLSILTGFGLSSCTGSDERVTLIARGTSLDVTGVIDADTLGAIKEARQVVPETTTLNLVNVPGSRDDDASLHTLASYIRRNNLTTIVPARGLVASGGTDMAVMGINHTIENGACVGVHSWNTRGVAGSDLPVTADDHKLYLTFYRSVGVSDAFYWFTLSAAGPDDMHWMSPAEINRFGLSIVPLDEGGSETVAERAARCDSIDIQAD